MTYRMSAPLAARMRQLSDARPALAADNARFSRRNEPLANDAGNRKKKICKRAYPGSEGGVDARSSRYLRPVASLTAVHIASRSGSMPNHIANAAAPCSTSIGRPSDAALPLARAARTHAVSCGR